VGWTQNTLVCDCTNLLGVDGQLSTFPYPTPRLPVSVLIGGIAAEVQFAGMAPGFAGLLQVNAVAPQNVSPGNSVPLVLRVGPANSQPGVTLAVN
jgi:uncharacterized protein (TIGR03437 family)